jgi:hypothetical protein
MKKAKLWLAVLPLLALTGCGNNASVSTSEAATSAGASSSTETSLPTKGGDSSSALKEFTGLAFENATLTYDGAAHSLQVANLPSFAAVHYSGENYVDAGTYSISATVSAEGYLSKILTATLTIEKATLTEEKVTSLGLSLTSASYSYDAQPHTLQLLGDVPAGGTVSYTIDDNPGNSATEVGDHVVKATLVIPNYLPYVFTATLSIVAVEKDLASSVVGSTVLFQNDLDSDSLYSYASSLAKVGYDVVKEFSSVGSLSYGITSSLFGTSVCSYSETSAGVIKKTKILDGMAVDHLAAVDATHFFYSVHNVLAGSSDTGIYYYDLSKAASDYSGTKVITDDYAKAMIVSSGVLYYINSERNIVSYNVSSSTKTTFLTGGNIFELTAKDGYLYYNKGSTVGKGLYRMALSSKSETKLSLDNGVNLSIIGTSLYYINKDLLTSTLYGKGIYQIPLDGTFAALSGTLVVSGENDKLGSLASDGTSLYYYRFNNDHFFKNNTAGNNEVDLMASFVPAEDTTLTGGASNAYYNGEIYFANLKDDGCLYKYNLTTGQTFKVLSYSVSNVYFYNGYLYFGSYVLTNYAEWRMNLETKLITKISSDRCESLRFVGEKIYYINVGTTGNSFRMMDLDGSNDAKIIDYSLLWGPNPFFLEINGTKAYFIHDPKAGYRKLEVVDLDAKTSSETDLTCIGFASDGGTSLYLNDDKNAQLLKYNLADGTSSTVLSSAPTMSDLSYVNGHLYLQDATNKKLCLLTGTALTTLASICPSSIVSEGSKLYFTSARTTIVVASNTMLTSYDKATSNGNLYAYDSALTCLVDM